MPDLLIEEKGNYGIDCRNAVWASDEIHKAYHACGLPIKLQEMTDTGIKLIEAVDVVNIDEWNDDSVYGQFPIKQLRS